MRPLIRWAALAVAAGLALAAALLLTRSEPPALTPTAASAVPGDTPGRVDAESVDDPASDGEDAEAQDRGRWRPLPPDRSGDLTEEQQEQLERLSSIGYLGGVKEGSRSGVTAYAREAAQDGVNFYTSGHAEEAILIDMEGNVLHRWHLPFDAIWPDSPDADRLGAAWWRRAHLFGNGDLLVIFEGIGLAKLDRDSHLLWAKANHAHHDLEVLDNGDILVLTREPRIIPEIHAEEFVLEDFLSVLDADGNEKQRFSVYDAFLRSPWADAVSRGPKRSGDLFHTNTVCVLDGRLADTMPAFRKGSVLTSMNALGVMAVWDLEQGAFVWARLGPVEGQHDPRILENGHLLFFDNRRSSPESAVLELALSPAGEEVVWEYRGTPGTPFSSRMCGAAQRLSNGNTVITESDGGRAFEVDAQGRIVWEFYNPERAGEDDRYIATISELTRLPREAVDSWLPE